METNGSSNCNIPNPGDLIGDNRIIESIAEGGMARIYKVKNEALEVNRVIKLMKSTSDIDANRFVTEARISAKLNHPNIVQCYYFGKYNDSIPYIEMEYVDGANLHKLISENGKIPIPVAVSIIYYVCEALSTLHKCFYTLYNVKRSGIVHRDIKPANILLSNLGEVKLADFGIAKPQDLSIHTSAIQIMGSTFYLSPEQLKKESLDFRTDIYSLGCVIYEMVTAQKAFKQNNISDIVIAKLNNKYSTALLSSCPENLKQIIVKCLNPNKNLRYNRIEDVQAEVKSILDMYSIQNPQQIIYEYIQNPISFSTPPFTKEKKSWITAILKIVITFITISLILFYGISLLTVKQNKDEILPSSSMDTLINKEIDSIELSLNEKPDTIFGTKNSTFTQKKNRPISNINKTEKGFNNSSRAAFSAFKNKNFKKCIALLSEKKNMNDTLFLCYLGSLTEMHNYSQLSELLPLRPVKDGYYHYLYGRMEYHKKNYPSAINKFIRALTVRSFYQNLSYFTHFYLAKSKSAIFKKTPNSENRANMLKELERFINSFCKKPSTDECNDILFILSEYMNQ
ncbi:MAG: serine/threonine-protein kinase [Chitinispirillia bacterium]|jgi:serine/threonine protein kinase